MTTGTIPHMPKFGDSARIDKWLWAARVYKTRSQAVDAIKNSRVTIGDTAVKPSHTVKAGDVVKKGQALAVMEAMKMEHTIAAPADGTVAELLFAPGDQVTEGAELLKLEVAS